MHACVCVCVNICMYACMHVYNVCMHACRKLRHIIGYSTMGFSPDANMGNITNAINKFKDDPSILKIKQKVTIMENLSSSIINDKEIEDEIKCLNAKKPTTPNNIPGKLLVLTKDICVPLITKI